MNLDIRHTTTYRYSAPVYLEPHTVRLLPRSDGAQRVENLHIDICPQPAGQCVGLDVEGNSFLRAWFSGSQREFQFITEAQVVTLRDNPFDYLVDSEHICLPLAYSAEELPRLEPYLRRERRPAGPDAPGELAGALAARTDRQVAPFLTLLCQTLHESVLVEHRAHGAPRPAAETLIGKTGACRDLAVLYIDACRAVGLAARFVSGYHAGGSSEEAAELHAWAEVYISGAGWRGFDPTQGLAVADRHVALAAGAVPAAAAPISGIFRGNNAVAQLETSVVVVSSQGRQRPWQTSG